MAPVQTLNPLQRQSAPANAVVDIPSVEAFQPLEIAADRCKGCGLCVGVCPKHVLLLEPTSVNELGYHPVQLTDAGACTSCALCARICPDTVFTVYARPKGT